MGSFPHELPGYRHISGDATRDIYESLWGVKLDNEPGLRIPNMLDAAVEGTFMGLYVQGEDILQSDPDTKHVVGRPRRDGMRRRARPLPQRDRQLRACVPAGLDLPRKGRHLHQCRAAHQPRAQGDGRRNRPMPTGRRRRSSPRRWASTGTTRIRPRSWTRSPRRRRASPVSPSPSSMSSARCSGPATRRRRKARRSCMSTTSCAARASSSAPNMWRPTRRPDRASRCF